MFLQFIFNYFYLIIQLALFNKQFYFIDKNMHCIVYVRHRFVFASSMSKTKKQWFSVNVIYYMFYIMVTWYDEQISNK